MTRAITFYFDFSSPYGYMASCAIDALAQEHNCSVLWKPILLGAIFKHTGGQPLTDIPLKGVYSLHDIARTAMMDGIPFCLPAVFPFSGLLLSRMFYGLERTSTQHARAFAQAAFKTIFVDGQTLDQRDDVLRCAHALNHDAGALLDNPDIKAHLKAEVDTAQTRGVFGSPFFIVEGDTPEPFWGYDRLPALRRWLTR